MRILKNTFKMSVENTSFQLFNNEIARNLRN